MKRTGPNRVGMEPCVLSNAKAMFSALREATRPLHVTGAKGGSAAIRVEPTRADEVIASAAARTAKPPLQKLARGLSWGADEKVWLALTSIGWLASRAQSSVRPTHRQPCVAGDGCRLGFAACAEGGVRPNPTGSRDPARSSQRHAAVRQRRGCFSFRACPAHGGVVFRRRPAAPRPRTVVRSVAVGLCLTRVMLLAHWASDVVVGFVLGAGVERSLRVWTGYGQEGASRK